MHGVPSVLELAQLSMRTTVPADFDVTLAMMLLAVMVLHYFDNFNGVEQCWRVDTACAAFIELQQILSAQLKESKFQWPEAAQLSLGAVVGVERRVIQAAVSQRRAACQQKDFLEILECGRLSPALAGHMAGRHGFFNTKLFGQIGGVATRQLHHRHHSKDARSCHLNTRTRLPPSWRLQFANSWPSMSGRAP